MHGLRGILKSATISFGQQLVPEVIDRAMRAAGEAELLLAVGSTLQVYPVAGAFLAQKLGRPRVIVKPIHGVRRHCRAVIQQRIGDVLPAICSTRQRANIHMMARTEALR